MLANHVINCSVGVQKIRIALENTNHLLRVLLSDPLVQKDQKGFIQTRLEYNTQALQHLESEAVHA